MLFHRIITIHLQDVGYDGLTDENERDRFKKQLADASNSNDYDQNALAIKNFLMTHLLISTIFLEEMIMMQHQLKKYLKKIWPLQQSRR